eukprot:s2994_g14.t1
MGDKVTWILKGEDCKGYSHKESIETRVDGLGSLGLDLQLQFFPKGDTEESRFGFWLASSRELEVDVCINSGGMAKIKIGKDRLNSPCQPKPEDCTDWQIKEGDVEIEIFLRRIDGHPANESVLAWLLRDEWEKEVRLKQAAQKELSEEKKQRQIAEAHSKRFDALLKATSDRATERACRFSRSAAKIQSQWRRAESDRRLKQAKLAAERKCQLIRSTVKIQAKWRQVFTQRQVKREREETNRRLKQVKLVEAVASLQRLWRLKKKRRERRWLAEQNGRFEVSTPYDAILAFDSLAQFLKEGKIDFLQKAESQLQISKESRYRIVAVVGLFDKGKTWLLNKLFGANLPSGKLYTTKGLSFLWIKERRMLVIDSAGVQSTVSYRAQAVDAIHDAQTTESLMFEMVSRNWVWKNESTVVPV